MNNTIFNQDIEYLEGMLKRFINKKITIYLSFSDSVENRDRVFTGNLLQVGKDYILIQEETENKKNILLSVYVDYIIIE